MAGSYDVVVIGGGPAGTAASRLLAGWGHSVQLLTSHQPVDRTLAESLPPSCDKLFDLLGAKDAIDTAGFLRHEGNTVYWGHEQSRTTRFDHGRSGLQVLRADFDRVLQALALDAGTDVRVGATVREATLPPNETPAESHQITVGYNYRDTPQRVRARFVLDCSGRAGVIARRGYREHPANRTTLALVASWRGLMPWRVNGHYDTLVESYGDGWAWSVPVNHERRFVTVMVDPRATQLERGSSIAGCYEAELRKTTVLRRALAEAVQHSPAWACDASVYHASTYGGPGWLLVGDAGSFIDPLSSFGVKKALASGWLAAVVAHTSLTDPALAGMALDLYNRREREVHDALSRQSAAFFGSGAGGHRHPFWTGRSEHTESLDESSTVSEHLVEALRVDDEVRTAFEQIRRSRAFTLRRGDDVQIASAPVITVQRVVLQNQLLCSGWPPSGQGVRYLRGVDLLQIMELAPHYHQVPDLYEAYNQACPPVSLSDFLSAFAVLVAKRALVWA